MTTTIRELKLNPHPAYGRPYTISGGLPWYRETEKSYTTQDAAWTAAIAWAADYEAEDRFGNMAHAHGVIATADGWRGVVNYYHSNT